MSKTLQVWTKLLPRSKIVPVELEEWAMKRAVLNARGTMWSGSGMSTRMLPIVCGILVFCSIPGTGAAKKLRER